MLESPYEIFMERVPGLKIGTYERNGTSCNFARSVFPRWPCKQDVSVRNGIISFEGCCTRSILKIILFFFYIQVQCVTRNGVVSFKG